MIGHPKPNFLLKHFQIVLYGNETKKGIQMWRSSEAILHVYKRREDQTSLIYISYRHFKAYLAKIEYIRIISF